jgi:hypothetical protein
MLTTMSQAMQYHIVSWDRSHLRYSVDYQHFNNQHFQRMDHLLVIHVCVLHLDYPSALYPSFAQTYYFARKYIHRDMHDSMHAFDTINVGCSDPRHSARVRHSQRVSWKVE